MNKIIEIMPEDLPEWVDEAIDNGDMMAVVLKRIKDLEDFAKWMSGCGYDFCQHEHFIEQRDLLLKGKSKFCG